MRTFWTAVKAYFICTALDFVSSLGPYPPDVHESNPFTRHSDGHFWPRHALITDAINTTELFCVSGLLWWVVGRFNKPLARVVAAVPFAYWAYEHLDAAFSNCLFRWPGLFTPMISGIFGAN